MAIDAQEIATRKLGPLPTWGWAVAILGAVVVFRLVSGRGPSPTAQVVGGTPGETTLPAGEGASDIFSGPNSLVQQLQTSVGALGTAQQIQTKLIAALNQRSSLLSARNALLTKLNGLNDKLRACRTTACRTTTKRQIDAVNTQLKVNQSAITTINAAIAALQKQLQGAA